MQLPLQVTFRHMESSDALDAAIRERAQKLNTFYPRITSCRVVVEAVASHKHQGKLYSLHVDLKVPGHEIAVTRDRHEDIFVALRDAFDALQRKLEDELRLQRSQVKQHDLPQHGRIVRMDSGGTFGFIETADGSEYYFSVDSVTGIDPGRLAAGEEVQFIVDLQGETPQAKRVSVGKHGFGG